MHFAVSWGGGAAVFLFIIQSSGGRYNLRQSREGEKRYRLKQPLSSIHRRGEAVLCKYGAGSSRYCGPPANATVFITPAARGKAVISPNGSGLTGLS